MGFLVRGILGLVMLSGGSWAVMNYVPPVREKALSLISPHFKERQLLSLVNEQLETLSQQAAASGSTTTSSAASVSGQKKAVAALARAKEAIAQLNEINAEDSSILTAAISQAQELAGSAIASIVQTTSVLKSSPTPASVAAASSSASASTATPAPCRP